MGLIAKGGGQDDATKTLHNTHRLTRLMLEQSTDDDLKEKRYTKTGHQVFMSSLLKDNRSRSDACLLSQAKRSGASPETVQAKKLNGMLYVKPATPEPVVTKEPIVQDDLAAQL